MEPLSSYILSWDRTPLLIINQFSRAVQLYSAIDLTLTYSRLVVVRSSLIALSRRSIEQNSNNFARSLFDQAELHIILQFVLEIESARLSPLAQ